MLPGSGGALYCSALAFTRPVGTVTNHRKARAAQFSRTRSSSIRL